jgi:polyisoprenoid-binding protein YceI
MLIRSALRYCIPGIAGLSLVFSGLAIAAFKTDSAKSNVTVVFKQLNVPVEAKFKKFNAQVDFNDAKPDTSKAVVDIDVSSFDLGDPQYNAEVLGKAWFNAAQFPKASFVSSSLKPASGAPVGSKYDVSGKLTIKGKTADVHFPLNVKKDGGATVFEGALPIKRLTFNIGEGEWKDTDTVADEVVIKFKVVAVP